VDIGVDVGSISTKVVVLDDRNRVLAKRYLMTGGRPLEAVKRGLNEIGEEVGGRVIVRSVGSTGSGRHLTGHFIGADVVRNEITAQARAAVAIDPGVDTIFEIGGQDSKYIRVSNGAVVDFAMNSACAAGTGSFLEEQADRLRINVANEFASLAMASAHPVALGERCTVFMESDLVHHQQRGATVQDLTAGLAYSIAHNYLNRVVHGRPIGERILFQGGVAHNASVVAAFESLLDRPVVVPPDHEVSGAIGAAILAREARLKAGPGWAGSRFGGFDLEARTYEASTFECRACPNLCEISKIVVTGERPFFHGARCDKFEEVGRPSSMVDLPDLFAERNSLLEDGGRGSVSNGGRSRVGIPRALLAWELLPFYRTFFEELGFEPVVSDPTTPAITRAALERAGAETCFPVKLLHGHIEDVLSRGVDYVFLPSVVNRERRSPGQPGSQCCPYIPAAGRIAAATLDPRSRGAIPLLVTLELSWANGRRTQLRALAPALGVSERQIVRAVEAGEAEQRAFREVVRRRGRAVLSGLSSDHPAAVIVGRPYNTCDAGACLSVPDKLRQIGVLPIPMEYLDLESVDVSGRYGNMFWTSGQDILAAARIIAAHPHLQAIYITNFGCGPDSFLLGFFGRLMKEKPFLELEIDEHSADAGVETRCEAFFDSLR
jgi:predicted CoA-substrate-specific enzyme activase